MAIRCYDHQVVYDLTPNLFAYFDVGDETGSWTLRLNQERSLYINQFSPALPSIALQCARAHRAWRAENKVDDIR